MKYKGPIRHEQPISARMADAIRRDAGRITLANPVAIVRVTANPAEHLLDAGHEICRKIQGLAMAYYSAELGEISFVFKALKKDTATQPWLGYNIRKMTAEVATMVTREYGIALFHSSRGSYEKMFRMATFNVDVFSVPPEEACNYLIWRQLECMPTRPNDAKSDAEICTDIALVRKPVEGEAGKREWISEPAPLFTKNRIYVDHRVAGRSV